MNVADIPKIYTSLAEWQSCVIFVLVMKRRWGIWKTAGMLAVFLAVLCILKYYIGIWPVVFWIPAMACAMLLMYACIWLCCKISVTAAVDAVTMLINCALSFWVFHPIIKWIFRN